MQLALISDIHSNLEALEAVLRELDTLNVDKIHSLGDVIGYGTNPSECLDLIHKHCDIKLMGNHEYSALGLSSTESYNEAAKKSAAWTKLQLTDYDLSIISEFKLTESVDNYLLTHASPFEPNQWHYILAPNAAVEAFMHFDEMICFFGHSHVPQIYTERENNLPRCQTGHDFLPDMESRYLINVGSVGQPRDNDPRACFVVFDTEEYEVIYHRVEYDINKTQIKMSQAQLPEMLINRLSNGR